MKKRLLPLKKLEDMEPSKARVLVAKDVVAAIKAKEMVAESETYIELPVQVEEIRESIWRGTRSDVDARKAIGRDRCNVCAVGAAAVGLVKRFDGVKLTELDAYRTAARLFPQEMLNRMEAAFEVQSLINNPEFTPWGDAAKFGVKYKHPNARLKAIFQNIINNDGDFNPWSEL